MARLTRKETYMVAALAAAFLVVGGVAAVIVLGSTGHLTFSPFCFEVVTQCPPGINNGGSGAGIQPPGVQTTEFPSPTYGGNTYSPPATSSFVPPSGQTSSTLLLTSISTVPVVPSGSSVSSASDSLSSLISDLQPYVQIIFFAVLIIVVLLIVIRIVRAI